MHHLDTVTGNQYFIYFAHHLLQARSKPCVIGPAITKLSAGGLAQIGIEAILSREQKLSSFYPSFHIVCGVDVSYETLSVKPALCFILLACLVCLRRRTRNITNDRSPGWCFIPWQLSLRQVVSGVIQPLPLRTSSPSLPRHLHRHHYFAHIVIFSSHYLPTQLTVKLLACTVLAISPTFVITILFHCLFCPPW